MLELYNTLTRGKQSFKPLKKGKVGLYSCGPTVYSFAHIGNFRSYVFVDILRRYLEYSGYKVDHIMNLTDIDDKTIKRSGEEGITLKELTEKYSREFFKDLESLNIKKAGAYPRATDFIEDMIKATEILEKKGFAYEKLGSVYFDISKLKDYGKLSGINLEGMKAGARVDLDEYEKDHPGDFTLLKRSSLQELKRGIFFESKWGKLRPGWHLECSVMSMHYLGKTFDIHTGGIDLVFPHHENEIAQSEALTGKKFVNYWLHNEHLLINGQKMSKSLGNVYTLRDLLEKGFSAQVIRYFLISVHYRQRADLSFEKLEAAKNSLDRINNFVGKLNLQISGNMAGDGVNDAGEIDVLIREYSQEFKEAMDDDLNTPNALAILFSLIKAINKFESIDKKTAIQILNLIKKFDSVFGLNLLEPAEKTTELLIPENVSELVRQREIARKEKDWEKSDELREEIKILGYQVEDTPQGPKLSI